MYWDEARKHLIREQEMAKATLNTIFDIPGEKLEKILADREKSKMYYESKEVLTRTAFMNVAAPGYATALIRTILQDFKADKARKMGGLSVFGLGVGYGTVLYALMHDHELAGLRMFNPNKLSGIEMSNLPAQFTKMHELNIHHGLSAEDPELLNKLKKLKTEPAKITYSIELLNHEVIGTDRTKLNAIAKNISAMTAPGGYSYHILSGETDMTRRIFESKGLNVVTWAPYSKNVTLIKLYKPPTTAQPRHKPPRTAGRNTQS
ncbi:MAG: hypothetical protein ABH854_00565 [Candidatus Diapherotrites archaeon]